MVQYNSRRKPLPGFRSQVAAGDIPGHKSVNKFGRNIDIDTAASEDVWDGGGTYSFPTSAKRHSLSSTSASDTSGGAGARTVTVEGLDSNWDAQTETVTLSGTGSAFTTGSYIRLHRAYVVTAGSDGQNQGDITITASGLNTITAQISASRNQSLMAVYTIAASKTGYLYSFYATMNRAVTTGAANINLKARPIGGVFQTKNTQGLVGAGTSHFNHFFAFPVKFTSQTDIKMAATVSANNTDISAGFDLVLVDDN